MNQEEILTNLREKIKVSTTEVDMVKVQQEYLGDGGVLRNLSKSVKDMSLEEKRAFGPQLQEIRQKIEAELAIGFEQITSQKDAQRRTQEAETLPYEQAKIGHLHPITQTIRMMNELFIEMGYSIHNGPEVESDTYCFQRLNVPVDHPARDMQDTIYIEAPNLLLRTQTSSIEARVLEDYKPPLKVICPGRVYRNEKVNRSNHFIFHQYQGFVVLKDATLKDLFGTFNALFKRLYGDDVVVRYRNKYYPEVEPGVGPDMQCFNCHGKGCAVCKGVGWIEMGGAGMIHPHVLSMAGIDPSKWRGFAFGLGIDRWVMAKYHIDDIRTLLGGNLAYKYNQHESTI